MKLQIFIKLSLLALLVFTSPLNCKIAHAEDSKEFISDAITNLSTIDSSRLSTEDKLKLKLSISNLNLALNIISDNGGFTKEKSELIAVQSLLGNLIAKPGTVHTGSPILKRSIVIDVDGNFSRIIRRVWGINLEVDGEFHITTYNEVYNKYNSLLAEYILLIGNLLSYGKKAEYIVGSSFVWARKMWVISQPDCINLAGWDYKNQCR